MRDNRQAALVGARLAVRSGRPLRMRSEAFSGIMIAGALAFEEMILGVWAGHAS
jgi:hypothetical protein